MGLKAVFDKTASFFKTSSSKTGSGAITATRDALFPTVHPDVDGADCAADCSTCTAKYPKSFKINEDDELYGNIKPWATHVVIATGKSDWYRALPLERGSIMEALGKTGAAPRNGRLMISASNMIPPPEYYMAEKGHQPTTVLLLPSFTFVDHVRPADVKELFEGFVERGPTTTTPINDSDEMASAAEEQPWAARDKGGKSSDTSHQAEKEDGSLGKARLTSRPCRHAYVILLCSQASRDARCGQSAPILRKEFERHLRPLGLQRDLDDDTQPDGVGIYFVSHLGGHKYGANVLVYRRDAGQAIWLGRVRPEDCEAIVKFTVLQGKVVKSQRQLRGGFDRSRGVVSW